MSIGSRLKEARIRQKMTQAELAQAVHVTTSAIGNYETGVSTPREQVLIQLMKTLGVDANFLYQDYGIPTAQVQPFDAYQGYERLTVEESSFLGVYRLADERARRDALELLVRNPVC